MGWLTRAIRPPDPAEPNDNTPAESAPGTVGPDQLVTPGDPSGVVITGDGGSGAGLPRILPSPWSGWPAEWWPPMWDGHASQLTDTAWTCLDLNASVLASMPPYLVGASPSIDAAWLANPNPDLYSSWFEFARSVFWDYMLGEAFVVATANYATGYPARFHVVPPWMVEPEIGPDGLRRYSIGGRDVTDSILHIRYKSTTDDARGHGPLEAGAGRLVADRVLSRYAAGVAQSGGVPTSVLMHPEELTATQASELQAQWVRARQSTLGEPAVLSGGVTLETVQISPKDMALVELAQLTQSRIAVLLGVPPFLVGLPSGGDSMTYSNVTALFDYHWRAGLRPKAQAVMSALSEWLLPRGVHVEVNRDAYVEPEPESRARTYQILASITDASGPAITVEEIRRAERYDDAGVSGLTSTGGTQ